MYEDTNKTNEIKYNRTHNEVHMRTIEITPKWIDILPLMLAIMTEGTEQGKKTIRQEFERMAEAADKWNELQRNKQ